MPETSRIRMAILILATIIALFVGAYCVSASPTPTPFDASKIDYSQFTPEEIAKTEAHREQLKEQLKSTLNEVERTTTAQGVTLIEVQDALLVAQASFKNYQMAAEAQIDRGNKAIAALDHVLKKLHLAKLIMCALWVAAVAFLAMKIPPPLSLYLGGGLAIAGCAVIWMWI